MTKKIGKIAAVCICLITILLLFQFMPARASGDVHAGEHLTDATALTSSSISSSIEAGDYYIAQETLALPSDITINGTVNLCLNGNTVTSSNKIIVSEGAVLNIYNCDTDTEGHLTFSGTGTLEVNGEANFYSGTVEHIEAKNTVTLNAQDAKVKVCGGTILSYQYVEEYSFYLPGNSIYALVGSVTITSGSFRKVNDDGLVADGIIYTASAIDFTGYEIGQDWIEAHGNFSVLVYINI